MRMMLFHTVAFSQLVGQRSGGVTCRVKDPSRYKNRVKKNDIMIRYKHVDFKEKLCQQSHCRVK
jgi:hypothetical protein